MRLPFTNATAVTVTSKYGMRTITVNGKTTTGMHNGIDLVPKNGDWGIAAVEKGTVVSLQRTGAQYGTGCYIRLKHSNGKHTLYYHQKTNTIPAYSVGQTINKGDFLGTMGTTGNSTGNHLHFQIDKGSNATSENPWDYLFNGKELISGDTPAPAPTPSGKFKIGDKVIIDGPLYVSSSAANPSGSVSNKTTIITRVASNTANPYNTTGDLGWMREANIKLADTPEPTPPAPEPTSINPGDTVKVTGILTGDSYGGGAKTKSYSNQSAKVIYVKTDGRPRPYALNMNNNMNGVTGWGTASQITKS